MSHPEQLRFLLQQVAGGHLSPDQALETLKDLAYEPLDSFAKIDHHRHLRTGFPEAIWGPGKTPEQVVRIMEAMHDRQAVAMATRIDPPFAQEIQNRCPAIRYYPIPRIAVLYPDEAIPAQLGAISILTAGTADLPVAEEAALTAELCGFTVHRLWDVGVAGIHRLLSNLEVIRRAEVLIVVAGMEGALPSVVAGLADCPVIAVPTSIGYGASFQGIAPLLTMLNSCAAGVGVVNIDNGFGAAILGGQILRTAHRQRR
jgi:NCAIR mutase (PurE)-related protein